MFEAALYIGRLGRQVNQRHRDALASVGADGTATFILGGQITGHPTDILLIYPEGNYIRASDDRPFLQIGGSKYGKLLLEMAVEAGAGLVTASKTAIGSVMSTARANLAVGPLYDLASYLPRLSPSRNSGSCSIPRCSAGSRRSGNATCFKWSRTCLACTTSTNSVNEFIMITRGADLPLRWLIPSSATGQPRWPRPGKACPKPAVTAPKWPTGSANTRTTCNASSSNRYPDHRFVPPPSHADSKHSPSPRSPRTQC